MKQYVALILSLIVFSGLSGCANQTEHLSPSVRENIHTISVDPNIPVPSTIEYAGGHIIGSAAAGSIVAGPFGCIISQGIAYASESSDREALLQAMSRRGIRLDQIFYQAFVNSIKNQTDFKFARTKSYDAQFKFEIISFGFSDKTDASGTMPFVIVQGQLNDQQGNLLWKSREEVYLNDSEYTGHNIQDYMKNRTLMIDAFNALMSQASDDFTSTLMY